MSTIQDRSFNNDLAAAVGDVVRARGSVYNGNNYAGANNASDANLVAQIAPVVLTSLRTLAQHGGQQANWSQWQQQPQSGYQTQQGLQAQQGQQNQGPQNQQNQQNQNQQNQGQQNQNQQYQDQQNQQNQNQQNQNQNQQNQNQQNQGYWVPQGQGYQRQGNGNYGASGLSPRGTLAAAVTPIVAEALARYQPLQNSAGGNNQPRPFDRDWLESISSVVADVTPTVIDALKNFQPQPGSQHSHNAANLQTAAQRGAFDDLTSVVAATLPVVVNALRDYQPQQAHPSRRNGSDDVFDVARLAAPIAIGAL
jgi:DNA mismatch repair ATPase MutL